MRLTPTLCSLLVASVAFLPLDSARAELISTDELIGSTSPAKGVLVRLLHRPEALRQLQALGIDRRAADARVAAMTDDEAAAMAARLQSLPAGGQMAPGGASYGAGGAGAAALLIVVLLVVFVVWWISREQA